MFNGIFKWKVFIIVAGITLLVLGCATHSAWKSSVQITELKNSYILTLPTSSVTLKFPKGGFLRAEPKLGGGSANPRYFNFPDKKTGLIISGWFEPEELYPGIHELWKNDKKSFAQSGLPIPQNVSFEKQSIWDVIFYSMADLPNMRANCVLAGTWIDLHISLRSSSTDSDTRLSEFLSLVKVEIKPK